MTASLAPIDRFAHAVRTVSQLCGVIAAGLIAAGVIIVCHMVFVRYALNQTTIWQTDLTTYCLLGATFIGSPYVLLTRGHVNVDVLPHYAGQRTRFWLAVFAATSSLAFTLTVTVLSFQFWHQAWSSNWVSDTMWRAHLWIPYASMPIGFGILSLQYVADLLNLLTGREPPFGLPPKARRA